jgi:hypothetical protein
MEAGATDFAEISVSVSVSSKCPRSSFSHLLNMFNDIFVPSIGLPRIDPCSLDAFVCYIRPHSTCPAWPFSTRERRSPRAMDASAAWIRLCVLTEALGYRAYSSFTTANCIRELKHLSPAVNPQSGYLSRCCGLWSQPQACTRTSAGCVVS